MISTLQEKISYLKKKTNTAILAHSYQSKEILETADYTGDSFKLAELAVNAAEDNLLLCGVHFMAETAKMLNPKKRVFLANRQAGCPMAESLTAEELEKMRAAEPDRAVVCYINTTADVKKLSDVCVTSSSAVNIIRKMKQQKILFVPDCNLGSYVAGMLPEKNIKCYDGCCPYHADASMEDVVEAKRSYPVAKVLVHPECKQEVLALADFVGSTTEIMGYAASCHEKEFIIGTEISIAGHLGYAYPNKRFYPLTKKILCPEMKVTSLPDVYNTLCAIAGNDNSAFEITMSGEDIAQAVGCINKMLELGQ